MLLGLLCVGCGATTPDSIDVQGHLYGEVSIDTYGSDPPQTDVTALIRQTSDCDTWRSLPDFDNIYVKPYAGLRQGLAFDGAYYSGHMIGSAPSYEVGAYRGDEYVEMNIDAPEPFALAIEPSGVGRPAHVTWSPSGDPDVVVRFRSDKVFLEVADSGEAEIPGTAFPRADDYQFVVERVHEVEWTVNPSAGEYCGGGWHSTVERDATITVR